MDRAEDLSGSVKADVGFLSIRSIRVCRCQCEDQLTQLMPNSCLSRHPTIFIRRDEMTNEAEFRVVCSMISKFHEHLCLYIQVATNVQSQGPLIE